MPANGSAAPHHAAGLRPPQQQQQQLPQPIPTPAGAAAATMAESPPKYPHPVPTLPTDRLEALSLSTASTSSSEPQLPQPIPTAAAAPAAVAPPPPLLLPELPCTPQGGFGAGREQVPLMAPDAKVFTVHVGNTYSQADYHVESLLEVRRLLRDFASISFRQTSRTGGR